jgi:hypothetical protein
VVLTDEYFAKDNIRDSLYLTLDARTSQECNIVMYFCTFTEIDSWNIPLSHHLMNGTFASATFSCYWTQQLNRGYVRYVPKPSSELTMGSVRCELKSLHDSVKLATYTSDLGISRQHWQVIRWLE